MFDEFMYRKTPPRCATVPFSKHWKLPLKMWKGFDRHILLYVLEHCALFTRSCAVQLHQFNVVREKKKYTLFSFWKVTKTRNAQAIECELRVKKNTFYSWSTIGLLFVNVYQKYTWPISVIRRTKIVSILIYIYSLVRDIIKSMK